MTQFLIGRNFVGWEYLIVEAETFQEAIEEAETFPAYDWDIESETCEPIGEFWGQNLNTLETHERR